MPLEDEPPLLPPPLELPPPEEEDTVGGGTGLLSSLSSEQDRVNAKASPRAAASAVFVSSVLMLLPPYWVEWGKLSEPEFAEFAGLTE
jgi:hypothetical protein